MSQNHIAIWLDHSAATVLEYIAGTEETVVVHSNFTHAAKESSLASSERDMHNEENHDAIAFHKALADLILPYQQVLLFGPTTAKNELFNALKKDHHFDQKKIEVVASDKMSEPQMHAFVKKHFSGK